MKDIHRLYTYSSGNVLFHNKSSRSQHVAVVKILYDILNHFLINFVLNELNCISDSVLEKRLHNLGLLSSHPSEQVYFRKDKTVEPVDDDHMPFLQQGNYKTLSLIMNLYHFAHSYS